MFFDIGIIWKWGQSIWNGLESNGFVYSIDIGIEQNYTYEQKNIKILLLLLTI